MATPARARKKQTPAAAVEAQLAKYRSMRDFGATAEPRGAPGVGAHATDHPEGLPFVVQKHAATRLHYDFRLGWNGVLKSWAVTKGPSYNPRDKRLAVEVEDHPIEYGGFEGTIPKGQYGGGTVMLWDHCTWEPVGDADQGFRTGRLKFILHGEKLHGHWTLIRMGGHAAAEKKPNWLLIKEHDEFERGPDDPCVTDAEPNSALTGRDLEAIASDEDHVWDSHGPVSQDPARNAAALAKSGSASLGRKPGSRPAKPKPAPVEVSLPPSAGKETLPDFIPPQLATMVDAPPAGAEWVHELKLDGYRIQARVEGGKVRLLTRKGLDWTHRMPAVAQALAALPARAALLDGEVVVLDEQGISSFAALQAALSQGPASALLYYVFDLLHYDGRSLRDLPLLERKEALRKFLAALSADAVRFSDHIASKSGEMFQEACRLGAEGIICKEKQSRYTSGRGATWLKVKCSRQQEFVIGGFTPPSNGSDGIGSLLLGYYEQAGGKLTYAGRTGTGFTQQTSRAVRARLEQLRSSSMPFVSLERAQQKDALWVEPKLVAEVAFRTWTRDRLVRQASFKGLREDKPPSEVRREAPEPVAEAEHQAESQEENAAAPRRAPRSASHAAKPPSAQRNASALPPGIKLTHPDKVLDTASGLTKGTLAAYYAAVADRMLPFIADRPLSIVRCPEGTASQCFFQKHVKVGLPKGIGSVEIASKKGGAPEPYITLSTADALIGLAQLGVLEIHPWGACNRDYEHPDRLIFDLDPDAAISWHTLAAAAEEVRKRLKAIHLTSFLKSTGGKGLHVVAPIEPDLDWSGLKAFAHAFVLRMEAENPQLYLTKMTKAARKDRIYLDYLRNERGATAVAPWSPRNRPGAPVSMPLAWSELKADTAPRFLTADWEQWLPTRKRDPWKDLPATRQRITPEAIASVTAPRAKR
jgi:bifunctional non-homologous end joining protein LigD